MSAITDAALLPRLPDSTGGFTDVANANSVADEGIQTVTDAAAQQKATQVQQAPFQKIVHKFNPKTGKYDVSLDLSGDTFDYLGNLLQTGQATMQAFGQARAELQAKRQFQEQHPIVSAIGKIASTSAAQYAGGGRGRDISPIVRAAGAFGLEQFGQSNAELAQQEAALTGQQFGVANQLYNQNQQDQTIRNAEARTKVLDAREQRRYQAQVGMEFGRDARAGLFTPEAKPTLTKNLMETEAAKTPEEASAIADNLIAVSEKRNAIAAQQEKAKTDALTAKNDFDLQRQRIENKATMDRLLVGLAANSALLDKRLAGEGAKADKKALDVPKPTLDKLASLDAAEKSLDRVEEVVKKYHTIIGPVAGRTVAPIAAYKDKKVAEALANIKLEVAQAIKATGAGARGFGPNERNYFIGLATGQNHSPEQNLGIIEAWRTYIRQNRGSFVDVYQGLNDPKYAKVLGKDADLITAAAPAASEQDIQLERGPDGKLRIKK